MEPDIIKARVGDCLNLCLKTGVPKFLGFLSADEAAQAGQCLSCTDTKYKFFGGFDLAERTFLGVFPDWADETDFPISAVTFTFPAAYRLSHRDFLGALMSLKLSRECVGDILVGEGVAVAFLSETVAPHVLTEVKKVGAVGVKTAPGIPDVLPEVSKKVMLSDTVASARLDCVVAAVTNTSRGKAAEYIADGRVCVNSAVCQKATKLISAGDSITVRGKGRFSVESLSDRSKKGRIILVYGKFT